MKLLQKKYLPLFLAVPGFGLMFLLLTGSLKLFHIPTGSMSPTIIPGDHVFSTRSFRSPKDFKRGEIVIFTPPTNPNARYIQRIAALPGDRIEILGSHLAVNGTLLKSPTGLNASPAALIPGLPHGCRHVSYPLTVPEGQVFLMGDNYANSLDSRYFGPVPISSITHSPQCIVFPPSRISKVK